MSGRAETDTQKDEIVARLLAVWKKHPRLRFMQLLGNVYRGSAYSVEDYEMIRQVEEAYRDGADVTIVLQDCTEVREGDTVTRWLAGIIPVEQVVVKVGERFIWTGSPDDRGWRFERATGIEYDPELGLPPGVICSYIVPGSPGEPAS